MFGIDQLQGNWKYNLQSIFDNDDNDSPFYNIKNSPLNIQLFQSTYSDGTI